MVIELKIPCAFRTVLSYRLWLELLTLVACCDGLCIAEPPITALAFSSDHQWILAGSQRGLVVHRWPDLNQVTTLDCGLDNIHDIAFSWDGKQVLVGGGSPGIRGIVQLRSWPELELLSMWADHPDIVYQIAWRDDCREWGAASWGSECRVYELGAKIPHVTIAAHSAPLFAVTYLAGRYLATAGADRTIVVSDAQSGSMLRALKQHTNSIHALAFQPANQDSQQRLLASASEDRTVRFWQAEIGRMVRFYRFPTTPRAMNWTKDGRQLIVGCDDGTITQLDPTTLATEVLYDKAFGTQNILVDAQDERIVFNVGSQLRVLKLPKKPSR